MTTKFFNNTSAIHLRLKHAWYTALCLYLMFSAFSCYSPDVDEAIKNRSQDSSLKTAIMGALLYLDDHQIRDREGIGSCAYDASEGDGCKAAIKMNSLLFEEFTYELKIPIEGFVIKNEIGEWASWVNALPDRLGNRDGETAFTVQDSSLFVTAAISYPLYFFKEEKLPCSSRVVKDMRKQAMQCMAKFKRDDAYNFWVEFPARLSDAMITGPYNIPPEFITLLSETKLYSKFGVLLDLLVKGLDFVPDWWLAMCIDEGQNPYGVEAVFNMPNDADDTSMAAILQTLHMEEYDADSPDAYYSNPSNFEVDSSALNVIEAYRDINRSKEYFGKDAWKGEDSGGYLTWLKDENLPTFDSPETGVIPLGVNNVDCVVNANAVFAKAFVGDKNDDGYKAAIKLLVKAIEDSLWPDCGLYYPQKMMFPFTVTRAFRDGGADDPDLVKALGTLVYDLIFLQKRDGSFPGGDDPTSDLATALGVISLLNIGRQIAEDADLLPEYEKALNKGVQYLLSHKRRTAIHNNDTFNRDGDSGKVLDAALTWDSGLFFSASYKDLAHWRSEAYTVAIVLEALSKYVLAYDYGDVTIKEGRKIHVESYGRSLLKANKEFQIDIR